MAPCSLFDPLLCILFLFRRLPLHLPLSFPSPLFALLVSALSYLVIITPLHGNALKWLLSWYSEFSLMALVVLYCSVAWGLFLPSVPGYYSCLWQHQKAKPRSSWIKDIEILTLFILCGAPFQQTQINTVNTLTQRGSGAVLSTLI